MATIREQADGVWSAFAVDEDDIGSITYDAICEVAEDAVAKESDAGDVDPNASDVDDSIMLVHVPDSESDQIDGGRSSCVTCHT